MKERDVKKIIASNRHNLPLSYSEIVYKSDNEEVKLQSKILKSEYYKDNSYNVLKPFKKIVRFL